MTASKPVRIALVGIGKIARDQHLPTVAEHPDVDLIATVSRHGVVEGVPGFTSLDDAFKQKPEIEAVVLCTPPQGRYRQAREAILAGRHVFLEKPPTPVLSEIEMLSQLAKDHGRTLFASWHSRCAAGVEPARRWLANNAPKSVQVHWKEDVRRWHPGQDWIFEPGGMGIFDPGINALSIITRILPRHLALKEALLEVPENRQAPIAASLKFTDDTGMPVIAEFDFRQQGGETWEINVETEQGSLKLSAGGAQLSISGIEQNVGPNREYAGLYDRFVELVRAGESDVDTTPLMHVADAFLLQEHRNCEAFDW